MVRQPLAHRIATDDALNSVSRYLPLFDRKALGAIKDELVSSSSAGPGCDDHFLMTGALPVANILAKFLAAALSIHAVGRGGERWD